MNPLFSFTVIVASYLFLACGSSTANAPVHPSTPVTTASTSDTSAPTLATPAAAPEEAPTADVSAEELVAKGKVLFAEYCGFCHGDKGQGKKNKPAVVGDALKQFVDDAALFTYLKKEMPKDDPGSLSDTEYRNLIHWLRSN